ncbi:MAG: cytochrome c-type biogenesis protein CcmH [Bellilinea sp.]|nr:cytochrome c-type biogenesis protein CcmH [Bellilinea sp.]
MERKTGKFQWLALLGALAGFLAFAVSPAYAQQPTPSDDDVNRVARQMYCPVCENIPLDVCPTQACAQWRELIRLKLSEGLTDEEIRQYFAEQYGDRVLDVPPARGLNWLVYVLPPVFILGGVWLVVRVFRSMQRSPATIGGDSAESPPAPSAADDPYLARIEEELRRREREGR